MFKRGVLVFAMALLLIGLVPAGVSVGRDKFVGVEIVKEIINTFLGLGDTPDTYAGESGNCVAVTAGEDGLEFVACGAGADGGDFNFSDFQGSFNSNLSGNATFIELAYNQTTPAMVYEYNQTQNSDNDWIIRNASMDFNYNDSKLSSVYHNPTQAGAVVGDIDGGNLTDVQHPDAGYDGNTFNFSETVAGLDLRLNFTGLAVDTFSRGIMRYKTSALKGDYPIVQMWSYGDSVWEDYPQVIETDTFATMTQPVFDGADHIQDGVAQMRIYKDGGNTQNHYYVDWVAIVSGFGLPASEELDPVFNIWLQNASLESNLDGGDYNITADWFSGKHNGIFANFTELFSGGFNFTAYKYNQTIINDTINKWTYNMSDGVGDGATSWLFDVNKIYNDTAGVLVGVGTADPTHTLNVVGDVNVTENSIFQENISVGDRAHIINSLAVGEVPSIWTASFDGSTAGEHRVLRLSNNQASDNANKLRILFRTKDSNEVLREAGEILTGLYDTTAGDTQSMMEFQTTVDAVSDTRMAIKGGNVGIGTTTPDALLEIHANLIDGIHIDSTGHASMAFDRGRTDRRAAFKWQTAGSTKYLMGMADSRIAGFDGTEFHISAHATEHATESIVMLEDGKVGMGITAPTTKLDVNGTFNVSGGNDAHFSDDFLAEGDGSVLGDFGIGTLFPTQKLNVIGDINSTGLITAGGAIGGDNGGFSFGGEEGIDSGATTVNYCKTPAGTACSTWGTITIKGGIVTAIT